MHPRPDADLTARARIRDAAVAEFAERGVAAATIRGIGERAGVSPALVQHHFGTKAGLRAACDAFVLEYLRGEATAGLDELDDPDVVAGLHRSAPPVLRYLARALVDGSPAGAAVFDEAVALTERHLVDRPGRADARTRAVVFTAMRLGVTVLHEHVSRALGADVFAGAAAVAASRATLDIVAPELLPDGLAEQAETGLDRYEKEGT